MKGQKKDKKKVLHVDKLIIHAKEVHIIDDRKDGHDQKKNHDHKKDHDHMQDHDQKRDHDHRKDQFQRRDPWGFFWGEPQAREDEENVQDLQNEEPEQNNRPRFWF